MTMKKIYSFIAILCAMSVCLSLAACNQNATSSASEESSISAEESSSEASTSASSSEDTSESEEIEVEDDSTPEESSSEGTDASDETTSSDSSTSSSDEALSESAASSEESAGDVIEYSADSGTLIYKNEELGFSMELPSLLKDKVRTESSQWELYGETASRIFFYYENGDATAIVLTLEEMSQEAFEKMKAEGGPVGVELGTSSDGRVVIFTTLQSNPFPENTPEFELFQTFPSEISVIVDSFQFIEE